MKCPRCAADISTQKKCSKCGYNVDDNQGELEVEFKDFKTSELLEIRHKKQTRPPDAETNIFMNQPGEDFINREVPANPSLKAKKSSFSIFAVVVLVLALIIGGLFLVRLLVLQK
jgi:hypothetical protein